jgi:curved DNA-binding protein CbpA
MRRSLYDLLGARPDDDAENVRKAFLRAAKESHPDHHGDDPEAVARFRQIAEAYDILRDAEQRAAYDRLLEVERRPLRSKLKWALSDVKRHMVTDAVVGVILTVVLAGGYELYSSMSKSAVDEGAGMTAHRSAGIAAIQPAAQSGASERDRPAGASAPRMTIAPPAGALAARGDAATVQTIEVARIEDTKPDGGSDTTVDQTGAKAGPGDPAKNRGDGPQERHDMHRGDADFPDARVQDVQVPDVVLAAEARNDIPGPSSSGAASSADRRGGKTPDPDGASPGIARQPGETSASPRLHAKRPPASRAPFRHASLVHRRGLTRMDYCEGDAPPPFGAGF